MKGITKKTLAAVLVAACVTLPASADQVILDDLIVDGSVCVGLDCVDGESFGFDTIRLKENNLRIKFQDTSTSASFPTNDWQITANDSSNGGANKFSIDDIDGGRTPFTIEAGAPSHSLYVDDRGLIGFGTNAPVVELHVVDGDTPTLRLAQDGSSGWTPQTWDMAGNETNFFIRDVTNGSRLPFRIRPGAETSSIDIQDDGVEIGTTLRIITESTSSAWDIRTNDNGRMSFSAPSGAATTGALKLDAQSQENLLRIGVGGADVVDTSGTFALIGGVGDWQFKNNSSTGRLTFSSPGGAAATAPFKFDRQAQENLLRVGVVAGDRVDIQGRLFVNSTQLNVPDYVFDPSYPLESIEEHAARMWEKSHLPALPSAAEAQANGVDLVSHQMGVLEELEKAHIYIAQLNDTLVGLQSDLQHRDEAIDELRHQVDLLLKVQQKSAQSDATRDDMAR